MIPDSITPVSGWRAWKVRPDGIWSLGDQVRWPVGKPLRATCERASTVLFAFAPMSSQASLIFSATTANFSVINGRMPSTFVDPHEIGTDREVLWDLMRGIEPERVVPIKECSCGIYTTEDLEQARRYAEGAEGVLGRVALWGRVVVHDTGCRGEFAYPQAFYLPRDSSEEVRRILGEYGAPILPLAELFQETRIDDRVPIGTVGRSFMSRLRFWT